MYKFRLYNMALVIRCGIRYHYFANFLADPVDKSLDQWILKSQKIHGIYHPNF